VSICLDRDTLHYKHQIALRYAELVYNGLWFAPLREGLELSWTPSRKTPPPEQAEALQGPLLQRRCHLALFPVQPGIRHLRETVYNQKDAEALLICSACP
jgi:argininosuccinate synthase